MTSPNPPFTVLARERCHERWATKPTLTEQAAAVADILAGRSLYIAPLQGGVEEHVVTIRGKAVRVVFAHGTQQVITCLPNTAAWNRVAAEPPERLTPEELRQRVEGPDSIRLSAPEGAAFVAALLDPPAPSPALLAAAQRSREMFA